MGNLFNVFRGNYEKVDKEDPVFDVDFVLDLKQKKTVEVRKVLNYVVGKIDSIVDVKNLVEVVSNFQELNDKILINYLTLVLKMNMISMIDIIEEGNKKIKTIIFLLVNFLNFFSNKTVAKVSIIIFLVYNSIPTFMKDIRVN